MKYLDKLLSVLILLPVFSIAQTNYKPGYVITLKGDTLRGFIDFREWDKNPLAISFKSNLKSSPAESYTTKNADGFAVNGLEYFKRFTVRISRDQVELSNVRQGADTSYITSAVFLRVLTSGKNVSLFSYTDEIKTRYYILDGAGGQAMELVYRVFYSAENATLLQTQNRFRVQVEYLAQKYNVNSDGLEAQISNSDYKEADLIKIASAINGETAKQFTPKSRMGTGWYAGIGATDNSLSFMGAIMYKNNSSTSPKISAGFDLFPNKNTQEIFFRVDLSFTTNKHSFSYGPNATGYSSRLDNVVQYNVSISPQVVYNIYNSDNFKLFVAAGASVNLSHYNNYQFVENENSVATITTDEFPPLDKYWFSLPLKAGVAFNKRIEMYVGYTPAAALTNNNNYEANAVTVDAGINYLFGVK